LGATLRRDSAEQLRKNYVDRKVTAGRGSAGRYLPGRPGQKAAGTPTSGAFVSQGTHPLFTHWQRRPGPAAAHRAGLEKARQDGGV